MSELKTKVPKTVPMKDVVYCVIILASIVVSLITGWFLCVHQQDSVKAEAADMLTSLSKPAK